LLWFGLGVVDFLFQADLADSSNWPLHCSRFSLANFNKDLVLSQIIQAPTSLDAMIELGVACGCSVLLKFIWKQLTLFISHFTISNSRRVKISTHCQSKQENKIPGRAK
jgi:hypothetical protein